MIFEIAYCTHIDFSLAKHNTWLIADGNEIQQVDTQKDKILCDTNK